MSIASLTQKNEIFVLIFGGRESPTGAALNDVYAVTITTKTPDNVRGYSKLLMTTGTIPSPRFSHSSNVISNNSNNIDRDIISY
jgi:hypothetical protein